MDPRAAILGRVREGLSRRTALSDARARDEMAARGANPPAHPIPARACLAPAPRRDLFIRMAEAAKATVTPLGTAMAWPEALGQFLEEHALGRDLFSTRDPLLLALPWAAAGISLRHGRADGQDRVSAALAFGGVAETGSLLFIASPESPMTAHLLCDTHLVLLPESRIFGTMEDALKDLRECQALPASAMFVTGPSRTADIEQQMQLGAHGAKALRIYLAKG